MDINNKQLLHDIFSQIAPIASADMDIAIQHFTFHTFKPQEYIFSCGDLIHQVHFVLDGIGRYFYLDNYGNERNKSLVRTGGAFASLSSVVEGSPSPFFTQALTKCITASIKYDCLVELSRNHYIWGEFLRKVFERLVLKKEKREAGFLLMTAKERYQQFLSEFGEQGGQISLRQVAMYIGVTDVTLSRVRREMGLT